jgi:hypothetical protein
MESFLDAAARIATTFYVTYLVILWVTAFFGLQLILLAILVALARRARRTPGPSRPWGARDALPLQITYGLLNPVLYLLIFGQPSGGLSLVRGRCWSCSGAREY